jgi:hypothetical protein
MGHSGKVAGAQTGLTAIATIGVGSVEGAGRSMGSNTFMRFLAWSPLWR